MTDFSPLAACNYRVKYMIWTAASERCCRCISMKSLQWGSVFVFSTICLKTFNSLSQCGEWQDHSSWMIPTPYVDVIITFWSHWATEVLDGAGVSALYRPVNTSRWKRRDCSRYEPTGLSLCVSFGFSRFIVPTSADFASWFSESFFSAARITAALCDVTSDISKKTSDKSVVILVNNSQIPRSCALPDTVGQAHDTSWVRLIDDFWFHLKMCRCNASPWLRLTTEWACVVSLVQTFC